MGMTVLVEKERRPMATAPWAGIGKCPKCDGRLDAVGYEVPVGASLTNLEGAKLVVECGERDFCGFKSTTSILRDEWLNNDLNEIVTRIQAEL